MEYGIYGARRVAMADHTSSVEAIEKWTWLDNSRLNTYIEVSFVSDRNVQSATRSGDWP